jgi:hypothetical protein
MALSLTHRDDDTGGNSGGGGGGGQPRQSTGNPQLDLELEIRDRQAEGWQRDYYSSRDPDDPYAGLMTPRERQWIVNIQLQQLKCENPFVDDYYFTVYTQKQNMDMEEQKESEVLTDDEEDAHVVRRQLRRDEEGPQLLRRQAADSIESKDEYKPVQFDNSLGKLQAISVKAPRKIIDVGVVANDPTDEMAAAQRESRHYKSTLLEIERLYAVLIEAEDCEKKLAALPTGTPLRGQVESTRKSALARLAASLSTENRLRRYLLVRKGKILLRRCFRHLDARDSAHADTAQLLCSTLFQLLPAALRKDRYVDDRFALNAHGITIQCKQTRLCPGTLITLKIVRRLMFLVMNDNVIPPLSQRRQSVAYVLARHQTTFAAVEC